MSFYASFLKVLIPIVYFYLVLKHLSPVKIYPNFYHCRKQMRADHKGKISGIYLFINLLHLTKMYVGQSSNILGRMNNYLNNSSLMAKKSANMPICKALLKHGQAAFCLIIIEYVSVFELDAREIFWISLLRPYYKILIGGNSSRGFTHSVETKQLIREQRLNTTLSTKTKALISAASKGENNSFYGKTHTDISKTLISQENSSGLVFVYSCQWQLILVVSSVRMLGKLIHSNSETIVSSIELCTLFRGNWYFTRVPVSAVDVPLITDTRSVEAQQLYGEMSGSKIRKAVFVFDSRTKEFICRYDGVMECAKALCVSHNTITKAMKVNASINNYMVSAHRIVK